MKHLLLLFSVTCVVCAIGASSRAYGHGFAGARFFPATLSTDDPFIADELSLPTITTIRTPDDGGTRETDISIDFAKRITPKLVVEIGQTFTSLDPHEGGSANGFGNLELGAKYELLESDAHEAIVSAGLDVEIGGTGAAAVGADSFTTWTPWILFGKGFGDLPESVRFLKPLALTGLAGIAIPTSASTRSISFDDVTGARELEVERHPDVLEWGFALEYSIPYLQSQVQDLHLHAPFDRMIPLVEVALETLLDRGAGGETSAAWLGGLPCLAIYLTTTPPAAATPILQRFSTLSLCCVSIPVVSGIANAWLLVGSFPALFTTRYGALLLFKLALFAILLGFGARNRLLAKANFRSKDARPDLLVQVRRNVRWEIGLGVGIVAVVGWLGATPPPHPARSHGHVNLDVAATGRVDLGARCSLCDMWFENGDERENHPGENDAEEREFNSVRSGESAMLNRVEAG